MRYETLKYVLETAKCFSMRKAAESLYMTQPALSEAISALEDELGYDIFVRSYNGVELTREGEYALPIIQRILDITETLRKIPTENIGGVNFLLSGSINVCAVPYFVTNHLSPCCSKFEYAYPNIFLNIAAYSTEEIIESCMSGDCDVGFISFPSTRIEESLDGLVIEKMFSLPLYLVVNSESELAKKKSVDLDKIPRNNKLIVVSSSRNRSEEWDEEIFKTKQPLKIVQYTNDFGLVAENIRLNKDRVCLVPISDEIEKKYKFGKMGLKLLPLKEEIELQFYVVIRSQDISNDNINAFLDYIDEIIKMK